VNNQVRDALADRLLYVAVQPIVDLHKRELFGYEALVRCTTPVFKNPPQLLETAIEEGVIGELGRALRAMAIKACPKAHLFLNIHPNEFDEGWLVRPDDPIFEHEKDVYLEITESVPLSHFQMCHSVLKEIRSKGVLLAVDDLGAGYSNLKYIADLAPEVVKLDRELVAGLTRKSRLHTLVTSIVRLCENLGAKVLAEGIETPEELHAVMDTGVRYAQGYLLARPGFPPPNVNWAALS
jgi:EAL domain-containing protein (putative c-di-GMP-specific phosphodiesterase class I)